MTPKPELVVLAGVNGAGKSSIFGRYLKERWQIPWYNPDEFARNLIAQQGLGRPQANAVAWQEGVHRLDRAIASGQPHAMETTLGGKTLTEKIALASKTHDVFLWYCGLASADQHISRVAARVMSGGHSIPAADIRQRLDRAPLNVIRLMPRLASLRVYDNSAEAGSDGVIPDPRLILEVTRGQVQHPDPGNAAELAATPGWARALVEAALRLDDTGHLS